MGVPDLSGGKDNLRETFRPMVRKLHLAGLIGRSHFCDQSHFTTVQCLDEMTEETPRAELNFYQLELFSLYNDVLASITSQPLTAACIAKKGK